MALEAFDFTTTNGDRLDLIGSLTSYSDEIQTGAVEKRVVRRDGALHQFVGAPPRQYSFSCVIAGRDAQQRYERLCAVIRFAQRAFGVPASFGATVNGTTAVDVYWHGQALNGPLANLVCTVGVR